MRSRSFVFVSLAVVVITPFLRIQARQSASVSLQAAQLLQRTLNILVGNQLLTDITLTGSARRTAGSEEENGTFSFKALASGEYRLDLNFPLGTRSELRSNSPNGPQGTWVGSDGVSHTVAQHNLWTDCGVFAHFTIAALLSNGYSINQLGTETRDGQSVSHLSAVRQFQTSGAPADWSAVSLQRLTATDIYLDSTTLLPFAIRFNTHPDQDERLDVPVEIRFSDYRQTGGITAPFHLQQYLNNVLALDFQVSAINFNSGLTAASVAAH